MQYSKLGTTGWDVSRICLGTMTWGEQNTQAEGFEQMDYALDQGVNFWDTAELYAVPPRAETYGATEVIIGNWFKQSGKRDKVILASKIVGAGRSYVREGKGIDRAAILTALEGSLKRLQTDYIDLYQLHWPNRGSYNFQQHWDFEPGTDRQAVLDNLLEVLQTLGEQVKAGKIRAIGLSNETAWGTMQFLKLAEQHGLPRVQSVQNEYSLLSRLYDLDMAEVSMYENVGLLAWSPLAMGILSGKYLNGQLPENSRYHRVEALGMHWPSRMTPQAHAATARYLEVAKKHGLDVCQMAIAFTLTKPFTTASIIGATSMAQLKTNIAAMDVVLSPAVLADIQAVRKDYPIPY